MSNRTHPHDSARKLPRKLSLLDATMINIGSMIGSGIFLVPATVAALAGSAELALAVWIAGGAASLCGALFVAELGAMMPHAGGQYVYLSRTFGPVWGYLYGWACFAVINTASIAAVAIVFATYLGYFFPLSAFAVKGVAIASVVLLTAINALGIKIGAWVQNGLTLVKMAALLLLVALAFLLGGSTLTELSSFHPAAFWPAHWGSVGLALVLVLFAFDGWIEITFVAGEVKSPERNLARSIIVSTLAVIAIYLLVNYALIHVLSIDGVARSDRVASDAAVRMMGPFGAAFVAAAAVVSTFGANNGFIFTCPRIYYAMAQEGLFFSWMARVNERFQVPLRALIVQAAITVVLIATGSFNQLATSVVFGSWGFYALSCVAVFVLRRRFPDAPRPYRARGYPAVGVIFLIFSAFLIFSTIYESPRDAVFGLGIIALGLPLYFYWRNRRAAPQRSDL